MKLDNITPNNCLLLIQVIECSWDIFAKQLRQASSLDDIISSHNNFIHAVRRGTLLDEQSQVSQEFFCLLFNIINDSDF